MKKKIAAGAIGLMAGITWMVSPAAAAPKQTVESDSIVSVSVEDGKKTKSSDDTRSIRFQVYGVTWS